jgi:hypothetical protein
MTTGGHDPSHAPSRRRRDALPGRVGQVILGTAILGASRLERAATTSELAEVLDKPKAPWATT